MLPLILPLNWQRVRLGDIFFITAGGDLSKPHYSNTKQSDFNYPIYSNAIEKKGLCGYSSFFIIKNKSITITARGTIGVAFFRDYPYVPIGRLLVLQPKISNIDCRFYAEYINSKVKFNTEQTTIPQLTIPKVALCEIPLPPLNEQIAIANILSALDRYLYALDALILKKEGVKKALSFELLSQRKRLKGFNQAWQRVRLGDIANYLTSNLSVEQITQQGKIKVYDVNNFIGYTDTTFISDKPYISIVKDGSVGRVRILPPKTNILSTMGALIANHRTTTEFLFYLLSNFDFKNFTSGSIIPHIYFKDYKEKTIFLPPLNEQIAIANILSALDNEITSLKNKKRQFENIKKALNHDLMSAKIRVLKK
ncbi:restriction endonuclease subunit S [Helicobacter pylori]|uniref:Restriction endonuclease subunit S n=1 Tax=Helicobacter pylori TaxID=210 RepID=A0AAE7P8Y4_HELPX|nr:restriction endonuclease subunit S [Helicobacter pylori]AFI01631.1 type I R-M system specificity subunit [Helicobacter pylori Shi112]QQW94231.1 restriction endonuclease subunit S [Helicobacter pylori]QQX50200.1 restriction endonuclease subunit S [Helicobacter pylori]